MYYLTFKDTWDWMFHVTIQTCHFQDMHLYMKYLMLYTFEGDIVHIIMTNAKEFDKCLIREIQTTHNVCMTVNHKYLKSLSQKTCNNYNIFLASFMGRNFELMVCSSLLRVIMKWLHLHYFRITVWVKTLEVTFAWISWVIYLILQFRHLPRLNFVTVWTQFEIFSFNLLLLLLLTL